MESVVACYGVQKQVLGLFSHCIAVYADTVVLWGRPHGDIH